MTLSEVQTVVAYAPLQNICAEHLVRLRDYDLIFEADPASGRHFLHDPLIDVTVSKMARRSITRPCFYIDDSRRFSLSTSVYRNTPNMALLLRNYQDFLSFLAHNALHKSGFDIVVSEFCGGDHFLAHILFFDPVDSKPQITLRNQGYSCRSAAIDGLHRGSVLDDHVLIGVFWLFRAFNVLKHCSCGIILPATSVRTETCECPNRENRNFKQFRLSQRQALDSYTAFTCCCGEANTTATLWQPESIIIHIPDRNFRLGEMQDSNDCAVCDLWDSSVAQLATASHIGETNISRSQPEESGGSLLPIHAHLKRDGWGTARLVLELPSSPSEDVQVCSRLHVFFV